MQTFKVVNLVWGVGVGVNLLELFLKICLFFDFDLSGRSADESTFIKSHSEYGAAATRLSHLSKTVQMPHRHNVLRKYPNLLLTHWRLKIKTQSHLKNTHP